MTSFIQLQWQPSYRLAVCDEKSCKPAWRFFISTLRDFTREIHQGSREQLAQWRVTSLTINAPIWSSASSLFIFFTFTFLNSTMKFAALTTAAIVSTASAFAPMVRAHESFYVLYLFHEESPNNHRGTRSGCDEWRGMSIARALWCPYKLSGVADIMCLSLQCNQWMERS